MKDHVHIEFSAVLYIEEWHTLLLTAGVYNIKDKVLIVMDGATEIGYIIDYLLHFVKSMAAWNTLSCSLLKALFCFSMNF